MAPASSSLMPQHPEQKPALTFSVLFWSYLCNGASLHNNSTSLDNTQPEYCECESGEAVVFVSKAEGARLSHSQAQYQNYS